MLSDEVTNEEVFTALKYTLALVAMLEMGLQKKGYQDVVLLGFYSGNMGKGTRYGYSKITR